MRMLAPPARLGPRHDLADPALDDARESLAYWERRARRLPRHAIRRRREARDMAARWRVRVADAERQVYGRGLLGLVLLVALERRLPEPARHAGRRVARRGMQAAIALCVVIVALLVAGTVAAFEVLAAVLRGLG
jgi:hypothetical protein